MDLSSVFIHKKYPSSRTALIKQNEILTHQVTRLISEIQATTDITTNTDSTSTLHYTGTRYTDYPSQVAQLSKMYDGTARWGCMTTRNIIDMRTAFSVGKGVKPVKRDGFDGNAKKELAWVTEFMKYNNLDEEMVQEYAKEAELEGRVLLRLLVDRANKAIRVIHTPWRKFNYEITTPPYDFFNYTNAKYTGSGEPGVTFDAPPAVFIYRRFGGNASDVNTTPPKTTFVLREIEDLDKAMWDWRKINRIFSAPTPVITAPDKRTAKEISDWIDSSNWRIGKMLILGGLNVDFKLVGWNGDGYTTIKEETLGLIKIISGTTGIPVHFLGFPELLSNRDTAENLIELIELSTRKERRTWMGAYQEMFKKAMVLSNLAFGTTLNPEAVGAEIEESDMTRVSQSVDAPKPKPEPEPNKEPQS
ncbi:MAG: hypothetical protein PHQ43_00970 [Dehalococcoidales bacterium]|nr:hypothetical protein [Dehalococcoidales bacterium]